MKHRGTWSTPCRQKKTWKLLTLATVCGLLSLCCLAKPDVSHLLKKQSTAGDKQKRQNVFEASVTGKDGSAGVPFALFPLDENQPSPFRRLEDRPGYNYDKPELPLDVHPDSNLVSPVSTQAPEYLPPDDGQETIAVNEVVSPSYPATSSTTPPPTTTTTELTTTAVPYTSGLAVSSTSQPPDGYDYKSPEVMLPTNINEVVGEPSDINQLATTTEVTTTTTPKASLEYLPPKPRPELVVPKGPGTTTTPEPSTTSISTTFQTPTETTRAPEPPSVYPDASASVSTVVRPQPTTEVPSTAAPEYLPPDSAGGFQIIVRGRSDTDDNEVTVGTTTTSATIEPSTTQQQDEQPTSTATVSSTTVLDGETATPQADASSVISLINQMQEVNRGIAPQDGFGPDEDGSSTSTTPATPSTTVTTNQPTEQPSSETPAPPIEARISPDEPTVPSLIDLLSSVTTTSAAPNDTITTYRPAATDSPATTTAPIESSADGSEVRPRIAEPDDDGGYNYETPDNALDVPTAIVPSHTLEADGYHYKVPAVPFPQ
ncbi:mucin-2-like [Anopheles cruzii]|uniref:mucin-2-like n=1 Tax=Anopheles cruzii TaxID=68878 RepID=UPI0022EC269C|nr:mucin-2-like [Anopheles cruzii]